MRFLTSVPFQRSQVLKGRAQLTEHAAVAKDALRVRGHRSWFSGATTFIDADGPQLLKLAQLKKHVVFSQKISWRKMEKTQNRKQII